jgi:uncharacterized protein
MIRLALAVALVIVFAAPAYAIDRNCPKGQTWSISLGTCVKKKAAPKLSAQEKFDRANDDLEGKGKGADPKRGVKALDENCTAGHGASCTLLGFLYSRGRSGITRDDVKSMELYVKACSLNDVEGCYQIGNVAYQIAEYPASRLAYQRACQLGSGLACARGGELFASGVGGDKDTTTSTQMFERAHSLLGPNCPGDGSSCYVLGWLFEAGRGVPENGKKAIDAYRSGCAGGSGDACTKLAGLLDAAKETDGANDALEKACNRYDNGDACRKLAERLAIAKKDLDRAFILAKRGCSLDPSHCGTLGELYRVGFGVTADPVQATRLYKSACEAGGNWCDTFGQRAHDGVGMAADDTAALAALERGCKGGLAHSCEIATNILIATKIDDARGFTLASMGCDYKHGMSCYLAGWMSAVGRAGGPASPERGFALYEKGCGFGSPAACGAQAEAYRSGTGVAKDPALAIAKAEEGCKGLPDGTLSGSACKTWGVMAYFGETGTKDAKVALAAFRRACTYGEDTCGWLASVAIEAGGKLADELPIALASCKTGRESACIAYGNMLASSPTEAEHHKAYETFVAGCARNNDDACVRQADLLSDGFGISKDVAKAEALYRTRCDAGSSAACWGMGRMYSRDKKLDEALRMMTRACDGGSGEACSSVGFMYYTAQGTRWDVAQAAKFFTKGCELGSNVGCSNSADLYRWGVGVAIDHAKAFGFYEKSCIPADPAGCAGVGHYTATGEGKIAIDRKRAEQALRAACTGAYLLPDACRELADLVERDGKGNAGEIARIRTTAFSRAKELAVENPYFMYVLGTFYADGMATVKDPVQALVWLGKACEGFDPLGCIAAGKALRATRKPDDAERARVYFERACAAGVDDGCTLGKVEPPKPAEIHAKGCGCSGEVAGGDAGAIALVLLVGFGRRNRRRSPMKLRSAGTQA